MRHARKPFPIATSALVLCASLAAQPPAPGAGVEQAMAAIRPHAIRAHMRFLADDLLEGRGTATRGYDLAARYVATAFEALGLEPAGVGGGYLQPVPLLRTTIVESDCSLVATRDGRRTELRYGPDYFVGQVVEADSSVEAPVVFAGFGTTAPELGYDDYAGLDVRGKIVAVLVGSPSSFPPDQRAYYSSATVQIRNAIDHGAVGVLGIWTPELERVAPWDTILREVRRPGLAWMDEAGRPRDVPLELRGSAALSRQGAQALFAGARHSLDEVYAAAAAGRPPAFELPVRVSLRTVGRRERTESPNVAAVLRGSDPALRDEHVVLSAHLDHVGVGQPIADDAIYNGAYDNASGVAILLEVARALASLPKAPRRSVLFLAVTGEESGLHGSDYFARHPTVPPDRLVANVNLDMVLMLHPLREVIPFGAEHSSLKRTVEEAAGRLGIGVSPDPFPEQVLFVRSDHYSFVKQGVPAIFLTAGFRSDDPAVDGQALWGKWMQEVYHRPGDDMRQSIDFDAGAQFARLNFLIAYLVAQADEAPSWNAGDFFGERFGRKVAAAGPSSGDRCDAVAERWPFKPFRFERVEDLGALERARTFEGVPFGALNQRWRTLRRRMEPGDELWHYVGQPSLGNGEYSRGSVEGYVLLRGCAMVADLPVEYGDV